MNTISIVIPVFNEKPNIKPLYDKIIKSMRWVEKTAYEIIFIDDGSNDGSFEEMKTLAEKDNRVKVIKFRTNFGQTAAMVAGFRHAKNDVIITMDGDLQNDPADIHKLVMTLKKGFDVVSGWRFRRKDPITKKIPSIIARYLRKKLTKEKIHDSGCTLKAYRRECVKDLDLYGDMHRYIPTILRWYGYKIGEVKVNHHPRTAGKTKYTYTRIVRGFLDLISAKFWMDYSKRPLHFFGKAGFLISFLGFIIGLTNLVYHLIKNDLKGVGPLILLGVLLILIGIQTITFGFLADIQMKQYYATHKKELYNIEKVINN